MTPDRIPPNASNTKITRVETIPLKVPLRQPTKLSQGPARSFVEILVVRVHTDDGRSGLGETQAWRRQGNSETLPSLVTQIRDHFTPLLIGRSPFSSASILHALDRCLYHSLYAQAAVADALCDLQGQILGVPVHTLLGGKCRDFVPGCGLAYMKSTLQETVESVEQMFEQGFRSFALKVGDDLNSDIRNVEALRKRFGGDIVLRVDANAAMDFDGALTLLKKIEPYDIDAAEQLLPLWDMDGMAVLATKTSIPFMTDECVATDHDLIAVIKKRAATSTQTKIAKNGGMWRCLNLWRIAAAAGMRICPGNHPSTSIATSAAAHVAAAWSGAILEGPFACGLSAIAEDIVTQPVRFEGNRIRVSDAPGLGVTLDDDRIKMLRADL